MSTTLPLKRRVQEALRSPTLQTALPRVLPALSNRRQAMFAEGEFAAVQRQLHQLKADAIARMPELVEQFSQALTRVGGMVHMAKDAAEARAIVGDLCRQYQVRSVVKAKSMVTEEIALNPYLEELGVKVVETDLGEWIVQLAGEHPSHLIAPAVHKTREEIARLLSQHLGVEVPPEPQAMVKLARKALRQAFIDADMGISGANIAVAETGSIVLVENEGNQRLATGLAPVHVAIFGPEKIVPSLADAAAILDVLARNATGQRLTSYVSFITGPSRSADIEFSLTIGVHGPEAFHAVIVDNGRSAMRDDPDFREALYCIRCAACANVCPPYQVVGGHAMGHVYNGPIGLVWTPFTHGWEHAGPQSLCASCNACETVCPVGIPIPRQILEVRQRYVERKGLDPRKRIVLGALANPGRFDTLARVGAMAAAPLAGADGLVRKLPLLEGLTGWRSMPVPKRRPLRDRLRALRGADGALRRLVDDPPLEGSQAHGLTVAYFPGCMTDWLYPEMGEAVVRVLQACGVRVTYPEGQNCCGLPAQNAGDAADARRMAAQTLEVLERAEADYILSGSTSCVVTMAQDYAHLLEDPALLARAEKLAGRVIDFTHFLHDVVRLPEGALAGEGEAESVTYHDPCQSHNCLGLAAEPRRLIERVCGLRLVEMAESSVCCGFGGTFSVDYPEVSARIMARKLDHASATGARLLVADNPGCLMHLRGGVDASGRALRVLHLAELLAERLEARRAVLRKGAGC